MSQATATRLSEEDVRSALREVVNSDVVQAWDLEFDFAEDALDSLDKATFALFLEENYQFVLSDEELAGVHSIADVLRLSATRN